MPASDSQLLEGNKVRIGKQIVLPISKAVEISLRGVKVRFWRSLITMSGIILAIAFMVSVWSGNTVLDGLLSPGIRDREVIREIRLETAPFSYLRPDGSIRSVELRRQRPVRNTVAEVLSMKGYQTQADAPAAAAAGAGARGKGGKDLWLVALSLCVAVVGIVNAMLMSVTERFREIGTMKCLGALDSFVVKLFLLESTFLGSIGTVIGVFLGVLLTAGSCLISYWPLRGLLLAAVSWGDVFQGMLVAFVAGTALSVLGAVYPAVVAARMEPVAALRQEA